MVDYSVNADWQQKNQLLLMELQSRDELLRNYPSQTIPREEAQLSKQESHQRCWCAPGVSRNQESARRNSWRGPIAARELPGATHLRESTPMVIIEEAAGLRIW